MKALIIVAACLMVVAASVAAQQTPLSSAEQALFEAAYLGKLAEVEHLVAAGTAVDAMDPENRTPMMFAAFDGSWPAPHQLSP